MCYNEDMRLPRNVDRVLILMTVFILSFVLVFAANRNDTNTYAEGESGVYLETDEHYVIFYDDGESLMVKTTATTVEEAISRAGIVLNATDLVEPSLTEKIDGEKFFINIHRSRPVIIQDGVVEKYLMTASYDARTVAREAGLTVYDGDEIKLVPNANFLEAGAASMYNITRNGGRTITEEVEIPFAEQTVKDYNLAPGVKEVRQLGEVGLKVLSFEVFYENNIEIKRELVNEEVKREPVTRIVAVGASEIERRPLTAAMGRNRYTVRTANGTIIERQETYYDLPMSGVMAIAARECGVKAYYTVRDDGVKVDADGYVLVAAELSRYPRCSVVETSLGLGKVYDTGSFALTNPEQFDIATDWTNRDGK